MGALKSKNTFVPDHFLQCTFMEVLFTEVARKGGQLPGFVFFWGGVGAGPPPPPPQKKKKKKKKKTWQLLPRDYGKKKISSPTKKNNYQENMGKKHVFFLLHQTFVEIESSLDLRVAWY